MNIVCVNNAGSADTSQDLSKDIDGDFPQWEVTKYSKKWKVELQKLQAEASVVTLTEKLSDICDEANK